MTYLRSFDAVARDLGIPVTSGGVVALSRDKFPGLLRTFLPYVPVDEEWYSGAYPDVAEGIAAGIFRSAREHYVEHGYFEGRLPHAVAIDEAWYYEAYSDVAKNFESGGPPAMEHFISHGYREGRRPVPPAAGAREGTSVLAAAPTRPPTGIDYPPHFAVLEPAVFGKSPDDNLALLKRDDLSAALRPFIEIVPVDEKWYFATYSDVRAAVESGVYPSAGEHFIQRGYFECRLPCNVEVDEEWYYATYPDVVEGFGQGGRPARDHFISYGYREGRLPADPAMPWARARYAPAQERAADGVAGAARPPTALNGPASFQMRGHLDECTRNRVSGWAADASQPRRQVDVEIMADGKSVATVRADLPHAATREAFPGATGDYGFRHEFDPPLSLFYDHRIEIRFRDTDEYVPNGQKSIERLTFRPLQGEGRSDNRPPMPVLVTSAGRSGSSLCMARLAAHPDATVSGEHPYETLLLTYYAAALRTMVSEADHNRSVPPDGMLLPPHRYHLGFNPFNEARSRSCQSLRNYWDETVPSALALTFRELVCAYYRRLAEELGKRSFSVFCEKSHAHRLPRLATLAMFGRLREIVLIRDPRDLLCSAKAFWRIDGTTAIRHIAAQYDYLQLRHDAGDADTLFVRYEDLVLEPDRTMQAICDFLEIAPPAPSAGAAAEAMFASHATSASPAKSIGRWCEELSGDEVILSAKAFGGFLVSFGYSSAGTVGE